MTDRQRGAVLRILQHGKLNGAVCEIKPDADYENYALYDEQGTPIATSEHPAPLASYAFANGALRVTQDYDLGRVR